MDARRFKTFRTFPDDGITITGAGTPQENQIVVHRTVVEFIIQLEEPITNTDDELDPSQAAELFIVRLCLSVFGGFWLCFASDTVQPVQDASDCGLARCI